MLGKKAFKTEKLDQIIKKGVYFKNCISAAPYTSASHTAYFTGVWPNQNGVYEFFNRKIARPTVFRLAKKSGFHTIFQTDFPIILGESLGFKDGVDDYFIEDEKNAFKKLQHVSKKENTLSFFHFGGIHYPYGFHKIKFAKKDFPNKIKALEKKYGLKPNINASDMLDESFRDDKDREYLLRYKSIVDHLHFESKYQDLLELYLEGLDYFLKNRFNSFFDKLIDFVDKNNALLVVFADHGENWNKNSRGHSDSVDDEVLRVPLLFYGKNIPKNKKITELVRTIDVIPTICEYTNIKKSEFSGKSIDLQSIDFFKSNREAYSQVWRVGDKRKIYEFQQNVLKNKKMYSPLKTKLEKESVYANGYSLKRKYLEDGQVEEVLFKNTGEKLESIKTNDKIASRLRKLLSDYNSKNKYVGDKIDEIPAEIANGLKSMGYNV
jgi:arylsulfatase A-like enzyme